MIRRDGFRRLSPSGLQGRPRGQPLQAIPMERADPGEGIPPRVVRDADVPHLRMEHAVEKPPVNHRAAPDPGAHREINKRLQPLCCPPTALSKSGRVHIRFQVNRDAEGLLKRFHQVRAGPSRLGGSGDRSKGGRIRVQIQGAESADPDGLKLGPEALEKRDHALQGLRRRCGGDAGDGPQILRSGSHCAEELGAACFNRAVKAHGFPLPVAEHASAQWGS